LDGELVEVQAAKVARNFTNVRSWIVPDPKRKTSYTIELSHGTLLGKRKVKINGKLLDRSYKFLDSGSTHQTYLNGHSFVIKILALYDSFGYTLEVDGHEVREKSYTADSEAAMKKQVIIQGALFAASSKECIFEQY